MSEHDRGKREGQFCSVPADPTCSDCPHKPTTYIEACKPSDWFGHTFKRLVKAQAGAFTFEKKYEAHHLVCVAPVTNELVAKDGIKGIIEQTRWCINNKDNMIAMPLWGHTVKWYCTIGDVTGNITEPPFKNLPQHDWDHNSKQGYTWEVTEAVKKLAKKVEKQGHKIKPEDIKGELERLSKVFRNLLVNVRGTRKGGTDAGWKAGKDNPESDWFHPFSMASTVKVSRKGYPVRNFDDKVARWIKRIADAIAFKGP